MAQSREFVKSALTPAVTLGILGGLMSGRGDDRLRSAGRGALKGLGTDVGMGTGLILGGGLGLLTGAPVVGAAAGTVGGGMLGHSLASSAIGPYETEEEKFERMMQAREAAKEKTNMKTAYAFGAKVAQSSCTPCDMPNSPTNKKHTTSASPAVLEADEKSEEIGKPETVKTEHAEAKAKLPEEGAKSAYAFGKKVAAFGLGVTPTIGHERAPVYGDPPPVAKPEKEGHPGLMATLFPHQDNAAVKERANSGLMANLPNLPVPAAKPSSAGLSWRAAAEPAKPRAHAWSHVQSTGRAGPPRPSGSAKPTTAAEKLQAAKDAVNAALGPVPAADLAGGNPGTGGGNSGTGGGTEQAGSGISWPMAALGGLGTAGIGALLYHLASRPKKRRRDEEDE